MFRQSLKSIYLLFLCNYVVGTSRDSNIHFCKSEIKCGYESCPRPKPDSIINIHVVPHSHFDLGWLMTVDQYFNPDGYGVYRTINSIINALINDTNRRFVLAESAYLSFWWEEQSEGYRELMRTLINTGNIEIVGGGWSMNDEAVAHYHSIIDQLTWGLRKLDDMFGECGRPKVGWQVDPFGHSAEMASIFAQMQYDGLFLGRIDYQDKKRRFATKTAEFIWTGNPNLKGTQIFTSILPNLYMPPFDICIDIECENLSIEKLNNALLQIGNYWKSYKTSNLIATIGGDNQYSNAHYNFENIEKIMRFVTKRNSSLSIFYSTPSCYIKAVLDEITKQNETLPENGEDFFPYATGHHVYWTGFFSSRPNLKRFERMGNNYLQICKQLFVMSNLSSNFMPELEKMILEMGIFQHHDAISGTSVQAVTDDYVERLTKGFHACDKVTDHALNKLSKSNYIQHQSNKTDNQIQFESCLLSNISTCDISEKRKRFVVTVYNPLSRKVNYYVRLPVMGSAYVVTDPTGINVAVDIFPILDKIRNIPGRRSITQAELVFLAKDVPPLGYKSYFIKRLLNENNLIAPSYDKCDYKLNDFEVILDSSTGKLSSVKMNAKQVNITQDFLYYNTIAGGNPEKRSGAYVFRPYGKPIPITSVAEQVLYEGQLVVEFRQKFGDWCSVVIRIYKNENFLEFDWIVGPIPEDTDQLYGREIITKYFTNLKTNGVFYTDSNGKQMIKRIRNKRPTYNLLINEPIAGNYYPVTSKISLRNKASDIEISILTDRAHGGSSITDGDIELLLYRLLASNDPHGIDELLQEKAFGNFSVVRGSHYLVLGPYRSKTDTNIFTQRDIAQRGILSSWVFLSRTTKANYAYYNQSFRMEYSGLSSSLPKNVQILTLQPWKNSTLLLRLEHIYEKNEHEVYSRSATVNIKNLFSAFRIVSFDEMTLGGNLKVGTKRGIKLDMKRTDDKSSSCNHTSVDIFHIVLCPMEIRTFVVNISAR